MQSPVTGSKNVSLMREIPVSQIVDAYQEGLGIDVRRFFKKMPTVGLYQCLDTGYRFYYPLTLAGDDAFYQELESFPWYYMDSKWEHEIAASLIGQEDTVLEIGCAEGGFLKKLRAKGVHAEGLELNSSALEKCRAAGLTVYPVLIEEFAKQKPAAYDVVCSFQVLEHVPKVREYITASLATLRPGGRMIVSVPNNESLVLRAPGPETLNAPPHHMGLWDVNSLIHLQKFFPMSIEGVYLEPLQKYHTGFASKVAGEAVSKKLREKLPIPRGIAQKVAGRFGYTSAEALAEHIVGHTVVAVFKKHD